MGNSMQPFELHTAEVTVLGDDLCMQQPDEACPSAADTIYTDANAYYEHVLNTYADKDGYATTALCAVVVSLGYRCDRLTAGECRPLRKRTEVRPVPPILI